MSPLGAVGCFNKVRSRIPASPKGFFMSMTEKEIGKHKDKIDRMTQIQMASLWRFAPAGHPYFDTTLTLHEHFKRRFDELGGMTPVISKSLDW